MLTISVAALAVALLGISLILGRGTRILAQLERRFGELNATTYEGIQLHQKAVQLGSVTVSQAFKEGTQNVPQAVVQEQNAKIDRLTTGWIDFIDKQERLAARIDGAKGGRPRGSGRGRVEEQEHDAPDDDDAPARHGQGMLPLSEAVGSVSGPRPLEFAPLPPFRMR